MPLYQFFLLKKFLCNNYIIIGVNLEKITMAKLSYVIILLSAILFFRCSKKVYTPGGNSALAGKWTLFETLADPGDGSGKWQPVDITNHYFIKFNTANNIESNAYPGLGGLKQYEVVNDSTVIFIYGDGSKFNHYYKINLPYLTISGGCIEACGSKFIRTKATL